MVPELANAAATETAALRDAALAAVGGLPPTWIAVGVADTDAVVGPDAAGTFAGYGVDVRIGLSADAVAGDPAVLPLCVLIAGWLRGLTRPDAGVTVRTYRPDQDAEDAVAAGRELRAEIDDLAEPVGVLVVADGANTLSPAAPGGYDPDSIPVQAGLDDALAAGDVRALAGLPGGILGRVAYQVLAGLAEPRPRSAQELYRGAPYGVGYFVGVWAP